MDMKVPVIAALMIAVLVPSVAGQLAGSFPELRVDQIRYDPLPAEAGQYIDLFVKVENVGGKDASDTICQLEPAYPFSLDPDQEAVKEIGTLPVLEHALFQYKVRVADDAIEGDNDLKVTCGANGLGSGAVTKTITINVDSKHPVFAVGLVSSDPEDLKADEDDVVLRVELQNVGEGEAKLVTVELGLPEGFSSSTSFSTIENLGTIPEETSKEAVFRVDTDEDLEAGVHDALLVITYKDDNNNQGLYKTVILELPLNVLPSPRLTIDEVRAGSQTQSDSFTGYLIQDGVIVNPSTLAQGEVGQLRLTVTNSGEEKAESVSVKVFEDSQNIPIDFDDVFDFIGTLEPGERADAVFSFSIDGDAVLKDYHLDTEIRFIDSGTVHTVSDSIALEVTGEQQDPTFMVVIVIIVIIVGLVVWKKKR